MNTWYTHAMPFHNFDSIAFQSAEVELPTTTHKTPYVVNRIDNLKNRQVSCLRSTIYSITGASKHTHTRDNSQPLGSNWKWKYTTFESTASNLIISIVVMLMMFHFPLQWLRTNFFVFGSEGKRNSVFFLIKFTFVIFHSGKFVTVVNVRMKLNK